MNNVNYDVSDIFHDFIRNDIIPEQGVENHDTNDCEESFMEGFYSDELPSERLLKQKDPFFPNHF